MPKAGEGATACLKTWAGTPDVQNKNVLFLCTGPNVSSQREQTLTDHFIVGRPHLRAYSPGTSFHKHFQHANRKEQFHPWITAAAGGSVLRRDV